MPTKQELLQWFKEYKKKNCPAVSGLNKKDLETLAKKHGFGTGEMKTQQVAQTTQSKPSVVEFFKNDGKKEPKAKPKKEKKGKYDGMTKEELQKAKKQLFEDMKKYNKIIDDENAKEADAKKAGDKKKKVLDEIKVITEKIKTI